MSKKFWAVWRETGGAPPSRRHETKEVAIKEAERLTRQTGESYYILEVIGKVAPAYAPVEYQEINGEKD